jgi:group I intron endonuclease
MLIYLLLNKRNNKAYVGQHRGFNLSKRWNRTLNNVKVNDHLTAAINKYGAKSFSRKILCFASCQEELDLLEQFWIAVYKSTDPALGYNQQAGGRHWCGHYTPKLRKLIGEATRKAWARKSTKEKWEHSFAIKIKWLMRTERQRQRITAAIRTRPRTGQVPWNKGMKGQGAGRPSARKGRTFGEQQNPCRKRKPFTEKHKERISKALKRFHKLRRQAEGSGGQTAA